jgi:IS30 family transposase
MPTYSRLTRQQRYTIESTLRKGYSQKSIAEAIGVHPSSVSREHRRGGMNRASYC